MEGEQFAALNARTLGALLTTLGSHMEAVLGCAGHAVVVGVPQGCNSGELKPTESAAVSPTAPPTSSPLHSTPSFPASPQQPGVGVWQAARHGGCRPPAGARFSAGETRFLF